MKLTDEQINQFLPYLKEKPKTEYSKKPRYPRLSHILAISWNDVIGIRKPDGSMDMPWGMTLKKDMQFFRNQTTGNVVIMGRNTFETLGFKPLKDRVNIVVSSSIEQNEFDYENLLIVRSVEQAVETAKLIAIMAGCDIFIMGGATIYEQTYNYITHLYITRLHAIYLEDAENERVLLKLPYQHDFQNIEYFGSHESEDGNLYGIEIQQRISELDINLLPL